MIDWGQAWQIGGIGFGMVFAVLAILAVAIWLIGLLMRRLEARNNDAATGKAPPGATTPDDNGENNGE